MVNFRICTEVVQSDCTWHPYLNDMQDFDTYDTLNDFAQQVPQ